MRISLSWLMDFVKLDVSADEIADKLSVSGLEVEHLEKWCSAGNGLQGFVIGEVKECAKHPNADKLSITKVDIGTSELLPIVCGAPNVAAGQKVVVATVGTIISMPGKEDFTIGEAKIRGEVSRGMICAEDEMGMGTSHDGILVLPADAPVGLAAASYFKVVVDDVMEIGLTANRGDAASHLGVARDVAALFEAPLIKTEIPTWPIATSSWKIAVENPEYCSLYEGLHLQDVQIGSSPEGMVNRLKAIGIESKNNVVDATNYTLHALGQPIHAFDADKIQGETISVRLAKAGEKLVTLDKTERTMAGGELVIADGSGIIALAGVMGGLGTAVTESTKNVFVESACFNSTLVRKTAKKHGLTTDASFRFERGTDRNMCRNAMWYSAGIMTQHENGKPVSGARYDAGNATDKKVLLHLVNFYRMAGTEIPEVRVKQILESLGFILKDKSNDILEVTIPSWRNDVTEAVDLYEEILRIYGFDDIPMPGKMNASLPAFRGMPNHRLQNKARHFLASKGFLEVMNNSLTSKGNYKDTENAVVLSNPLSSDMEIMRMSLLPAMLQSAAYNRNRKTHNIRFFEFGKTYRMEKNTVVETNQLCILAGGNRTEESWESKELEMDYFYMKSLVENLLLTLKAGDSMRNAVTVSPVSEAEAKAHDVNGTFWYADIVWDAETLASAALLRVTEPNKFPLMRRDLSLVVDRGITFDKINAVISGQKIATLKDLRVFDVFEGKPLDDSKKAIAIAFYLGQESKTMTDEEADKVMHGLMQAFETQTGATIRR